MKKINLNVLGGRERTRMIVRIRDKFTCQDCGKVRTPEMAQKEGKRLFDIHHYRKGECGKKSKSYDKVADIDNLITLCHRCHFNRPEHKSRALTESKCSFCGDIYLSRLKRKNNWCKKCYSSIYLKEWRRQKNLTKTLSTTAI